MCVEAEIPLRERVEARALDPHVEPDAEPNRARVRETVLESRKQLPERALSAGEQSVNVPALRNTVAVERIGGQDVAFQYQHSFEMVCERPRRGEPSHPGPDDYRLLSDEARHRSPPIQLQAVEGGSL